MNKVIKILKDTPFHKAGVELSIIDFRMAYGWICTTSTTNDELIKYIETEWKLNQPRPHQKEIGDWFQVINKLDLEPLQCIIEDVYYTKGFDGMYHLWTSPSAFKLEQSIGMITIPEMRKLISEAKYTKEILYCTNDVNKKL